MKITRVQHGSIRAYVTIRLGGVTIKDAKVIQQDGQKAWVRMPEREWTGDDGKKKYSQVVELSASLLERVTTAILAALE